MTNHPTFLLASAFAADGTKTLPPATSSEAGVGRFSQAEGFAVANETPLSEGGVPPYRSDFNGLLWVLSSFALWYQQGGVMTWQSTLTYEAGNEVLYNGTKYRCKAECINVVPTNKTYWKNLDSNVPIGACIPFGNVVSIDSDGHPTFYGETEADTSWALCNGSNGTPNLVNRIVRGTNGVVLSYSGADSVTLGVANLPAHSHGVTCSTEGSHQHDRGDMEISGYFMGENETYYTGGAFTHSGGGNANRSEGNNGNNNNIDFRASRAWTGNTSSNGAHTHTITIQSTGGGSAISVRQADCSLPYFMKISE